MVLPAVAAFLVVGLHLPSMPTAWTNPSAMTEYASSPTPFWLVELMDLGIVVPAAVVTVSGYDDPDASPAFAGVLVALTAVLYRPLFARR